MYSLLFLALISLAVDPAETVTAVPTATSGETDVSSVGDTGASSSASNKYKAKSQVKATSDYTILSSDMRGLTISYHPVLPKTGKLNKPKLANLSMGSNYQWDNEPGRPRLPMRLFHLVVPHGTTPVVSAKVYDTQDWGRMEVPRVPAYKKAERDGIVTLEPVTASALLSARSEAAELLEVGCGRGLTTATVAALPLTVTNDRVMARSKIVIRIDFVPNPKAAPLNRALALPRTDDPEGLRKLLLNYDVVASSSPVRGEVSQIAANSPAITPSILPLPAWKLYVKEQGMIKVTGTWLKSNGVLLQQLDPALIKIYGSDGKVLAEDSFDRKSINEIPIDMHDGGDGVFNENDWFAFYGTGTWFLDSSLAWSRNNYTEYNVYWLTASGGTGRRMTVRDATPGSLPLASSYKDRNLGEQDIMYYGIEDTLRAGYDTFYWGVTSASAGSEARATYTGSTLTTYGATRTGTAHLSGQIIGKIGGTNNHHTLIYLNDITEEKKIVDLSWTGTDAQNIEADFPANLLSASNNQLIVVEKNETGAGVDIVIQNYFRITYDSAYKARSNRLLFKPDVESGSPKTYEVTGFTSSDLYLYEVNSGELLANVEKTNIGGSWTLRFNDSVAGSRRFAALSTDKFYTPVGIRQDRPLRLPNDSTGADIIYIIHPKYSGGIDALLSFRRSQGLRAQQVFVDDIFDEYSAGMLDPTAIRNFLQHAYTSWSGTPPSLVTLVGDASYDYRNIINPNADSNLYATYGFNEVPTHHAILTGSLANTACDNWFVCFDGVGDLKPEMGITRISPDSQTQLDNMVTKIVGYEQNPNLGDWRMNNMEVADNTDYDGAGWFTGDAEELFSDFMPVGQTAVKLYLESVGFTDEQLGPGQTGIRQVIAREEFSPQITSHFGNLFSQYSGHGARQLWAHEHMLWERIGTGADDVLDIEEMTNGTRYPMVMMMSCSTAQFDELPERVGIVDSGDSLAEYFLRRSEKGAIAAEGSSRVAQESTHQFFQNNFYSVYFPSRTLPDSPLMLGNAFWATKQLMSSNESNHAYTLFADAATRLAVPRSSVNLAISPTTVARGGLLEVTGSVGDASFNGKARVFLEDTVQYYMSQLIYPIPHQIVKPRRISIAEVNVVNGSFSAVLPIPLNAAPLSTALTAQARCYIWNDQTKRDGCTKSEFVFDVNGTASSDDLAGPVISIGLVNGPFSEGDSIASHSHFRIKLNDESGMLIAPEGDPQNPSSQPLAAVISGEGISSIVIDCTELYQPTTGDYTSGTVEFPVSLKPGSYTLTFTANDNRLNESAKSVNFSVGSGLAISRALVCPNPVVQNSFFTFELSKPANTARINVYTVTGRLVRQISAYGMRSGYNEVAWDGKDSRGNRLANGCYFYVLTVRNADDKATFKGKLLVMR